MRTTVAIQIDGEAVEVRELKPRENMAWREQFEAEFGSLVEFVTSTAEGLGEIEFEQGADLIAFLRQGAGLLLPAIDKIWPLCVAYDARFEEAYESECVAAFPEVLSLAYPFGSVLERLKPYLVQSGLLEPLTSTNSPPPNGAGARTKGTRRSTRNTSPAT